VATTVCATVDDGLELAEIDLLRNWLPVSMVDRRRHWDIERIVAELKVWWARRQNETPPRVPGLSPELAEVA
jgi:hypothetical protein